MNNREKFKAEIVKKYGNKKFTTEQAKDACKAVGLTDSQFRTINAHVLRHIKIEKGVFAFSKDHHFGSGQKTVKKTEAVIKAEKKKTLKKDQEVLNEVVVPVPAKLSHAPKETVFSQKLSDTVVSLIPKKDPQYVTWGHFKDIKTILERKIFYPIFVTGLSGNGKTSMIHEVCAKLKRDLVRINITIETDEDDLLGGFRLVNGETVWQDGPLVVAMKTGAVALIDEVDLASHKIMCLQPIMEGQPIYLKKINEVVYPAEGFNVVATANTKGKGSEDGRFMGTNILNEAFLDRFAATFYQEYPSVAQETKILKKQLATHEIVEDNFVDNLVKWADVIRKSFNEGAVDEIITTRRLIDITTSYAIFGDKMKAVVLCLNRFDDETRESFTDFYTKVDAGVSMEDLLKPEVGEIEDQENDEEVPF